MYYPKPSFKGSLDATGWGGLAPWRIAKRARKDWEFMTTPYDMGKQRDKTLLTQDPGTQFKTLLGG